MGSRLIIQLLLISLFLSSCGGDSGGYGGFGDSKQDSIFSEPEWEAIKSLSNLSEAPLDPTNNVSGNEGAAKLGQKFYFDTRFSNVAAGGVACATCHNPATGFADQRSNTSLGASFTERNAPTIYNTAFNDWFFWDGRRDSLWAQALGPVESSVEHNFSRDAVAQVINNKYKSDYEALFGPLSDVSTASAVNTIFANFGKSIAAYERKIVSRNSAFDQYAHGQHEAISPSAKRGLKLFIGEAFCVQCHSGPNFTDNQFHNLGLRQSAPNVPTSDQGRSAGIPKVLADPFNGAGSFSDDLGTGSAKLSGLGVTADSVGAFKTPTLRSIAETAPYFHNGSVGSLRAVVEFYNRGGDSADSFDGTKDFRNQPLNLSNQQIDDLVEFLLTLDGEPLDPSLENPPALP